LKHFFTFWIPCWVIAMYPASGDLRLGNLMTDF
jgi:hypothetical protein